MSSNLIAAFFRTKTPETARTELLKHLPASAQYELSQPIVSAVALDATRSAQGVELLQRAAEAVCGTLEVTSANYSTDASEYSNEGIPAVVLGPGSIAQANTADEFVELHQVEQAQKLYEQFLIQ